MFHDFTDGELFRVLDISLERGRGDTAQLVVKELQNRGRFVIRQYGNKDSDETNAGEELERLHARYVELLLKRKEAKK
jgi:hypothetical protein